MKTEAAFLSKLPDTLKGLEVAYINETMISVRNHTGFPNKVIPVALATLGLRIDEQGEHAFMGGRVNIPLLPGELWGEVPEDLRPD